MKSQGFLPPHGNYRELLAFQKSLVIYDLTFHFCERHVTYEAYRPYVETRPPEVVANIAICLIHQLPPRPAQTPP
jgi:hypothetical protein